MTASRDSSRPLSEHERDFIRWALSFGMPRRRVLSELPHTEAIPYPEPPLKGGRTEGER